MKKRKDRKRERARERKIKVLTPVGKQSEKSIFFLGHRDGIMVGIAATERSEMRILTVSQTMPASAGRASRS